MDKVDFAIERLINELENNKSLDAMLVSKIKQNKKELKRYWYYTKIIQDTKISPMYFSMNKQDIKDALKQDRVTLKSVKKDNKVIRKEIKDLRKGL